MHACVKAVRLPGTAMWEQILWSHLHALVELTKRFAVEEPRAGQEQEARAPRFYDFDDPNDRRDFVMLMISIVIMGFGIWWVTPW
jgi:hypothetical protein